MTSVLIGKEEIWNSQGESHMKTEAEGYAHQGNLSLWGAARSLERGMEWPHLPQALQKGSALLDPRLLALIFRTLRECISVKLPTQPVPACSKLSLQTQEMNISSIIYHLSTMLFCKRDTILKNYLCTGSQIKCFLLKLIFFNIKISSKMLCS